MRQRGRNDFIAGGYRRRAGKRCKKAIKADRPIGHRSYAGRFRFRDFCFVAGLVFFPATGLLRRAGAGGALAFLAF
jgi:hypothetical protein